ncbi:hypothetical protein BDY17DRAFT_50766 [Neohortaea acidophila]|uniref:Uncharacterized protein n=1 Tax=Neohortaea acidophila TaxID=245834 RepID=A0A6A6PGQ1_9PEZI|nr:uncharacterized protein BDY17DRAFT_50766 [Neohortaea acidophila]KAF2479159.1 hypothetical protein BDY17DRAFT_50766 [Neohortaea acidophila]
MRSTAFLFSLLAAVAVASPGRKHHPRHHHHEPHGHPYRPVCTTTVTKAQGTVTSTVYTGISSKIITITTGTATSTSTTTTSTTILPTITSCAAPSVASKKRSLIRSRTQLATSIFAGARPPLRSIDTRRQSLCRPSLLLHRPLRLLKRRRRLPLPSLALLSHRHLRTWPGPSSLPTRRDKTRSLSILRSKAPKMKISSPFELSMRGPNSTSWLALLSMTQACYKMVLAIPSIQILNPLTPFSTATQSKASSRHPPLLLAQRYRARFRRTRMTGRAR